MAGIVSVLIEPRGPITVVSAWAFMLIGLVAGLATGALTNRRWVVLATAVGYAVAVEAGRWNLPGPTTADFRIDNVYGVIALIITRGFHGLIVFLPMVFGVALAVWFVRRRAAAGSDKRVRRPFSTAVLGVLCVGLAVAVTWPPRTPPVLAADGSEVPGAIAELAGVDVNGTQQTVMIRAADPDKPVLLYLSGGPGQSDLALSRALTTGWVSDMVFADLDQRGNGTSYPAIDPVESMTLDQAVADVITVSEYLRDRFDEDKIFLMGESWGTILGVLAVERRPDLYHAYIGSGQMVNVLETDKRVYADLVAYADDAGDAELAAALNDVGAPPYRDFPWANSNLLTWYDHLYRDYTPSEGYQRRGDAANLDPFGVVGTEYSLVQKMTVLRGLIDTFALMYPQLYDVDLRRVGRKLDVPVIMLDGAAELRGRRALALQWFRSVDAPYKKRVTFENAAHSVAFEQADEVQRLFREEIVPRAQRVVSEAS